MNNRWMFNQLRRGAAVLALAMMGCAITPDVDDPSAIGAPQNVEAPSEARGEAKMTRPEMQREPVMQRSARSPGELRFVHFGCARYPEPEGRDSRDPSIELGLTFRVGEPIAPYTAYRCNSGR